MDAELRYQLIDIFHKVKTRFRFHPDLGGEQWSMPPPGYNGRQSLRDDCDGFCLACRTLLRREEIPSRLVYCEIKEPGKFAFGHLVVEVEGWILDNLQDTVVANHELKNYQWLRISGYEPGDQWREVIFDPA